MTRVATLSGPKGQIATFSSNDVGPWPQLDLMDIAGWHGGVGVKDNSSPRLRHGMFTEPTRYTGRGITIYVFTKYETDEQRSVLERGFSSMLEDGALYDLTVSIEGLELTAKVKQDGEIGIAREGIDALNIIIPLEAPDPFLYGKERNYQLFPAGFGEGLVYPLAQNGVLDYGDVAPGAAIPVTNFGTAKAWPRIVVQGTWPSGFRIINGQDVVEYGSPVFPQSPVEIDMLTGSITVIQNRVRSDRTHLATRRKWFGVEPGETIQPRLTPVGQGTGWADIYLSDTYL